MAFNVADSALDISSSELPRNAPHRFATFLGIIWAYKLSHSYRCFSIPSKIFEVLSSPCILLCERYLLELWVVCWITVAAAVVIGNVLLDAELEMANVLTKFRALLRSETEHNRQIV